MCTYVCTDTQIVYFKVEFNGWHWKNWTFTLGSTFQSLISSQMWYAELQQAPIEVIHLSIYLYGYHHYMKVPMDEVLSCHLGNPRMFYSFTEFLSSGLFVFKSSQHIHT